MKIATFNQAVQLQEAIEANKKEGADLQAQFDALQDPTPEPAVGDPTATTSAAINTISPGPDASATVNEPAD